MPEMFNSLSFVPKPSVRSYFDFVIPVWDVSLRVSDDVSLRVSNDVSGNPETPLPASLVAR